MDMLQTVIRPSIDSARIASPRYSMMWPCPPPVPMRAMIARIEVLGGDARRQRALDRDGHRLGPGQRQGLRGQDVLDLAGADAERQRAEGAMRRGVRVAADDRHARLGQAELRADDVDDALVARRPCGCSRTPNSCAVACAGSRPACARPGRRSAGRCRSSGRCGPRSPTSGRGGGPCGRPAAARRTPAGWSPRGSGAGRCRAGRARPPCVGRRGRPRPSPPVSGCVDCQSAAHDLLLPGVTCISGAETAILRYGQL